MRKLQGAAMDRRRRLQYQWIEPDGRQVKLTSNESQLLRMLYKHDIMFFNDGSVAWLMRHCRWMTHQNFEKHTQHTTWFLFTYQIRRADKDLRGPKNLVHVVNDQLNPYHRQRHCLQPLRPVWQGIPADNETFPQIGRFNHQKVTPLLATIFGLNLPGFSEDKIQRRLTVLWPSNMCIVCGGTP